MAVLGRTGAEYAHLDTLFDYDPAATGELRTEVAGIEHFYALRDDGGCQRIGCGRADAIIDVYPIRFVADRDHLGTQLVKDIRRNMVGSPMGTIDDDLQTTQVK